MVHKITVSKTTEPHQTESKKKSEIISNEIVNDNTDTNYEKQWTKNYVPLGTEGNDCHSP